MSAPLTEAELAAMEARCEAVPYPVIPHSPQEDGSFLLCFADAADTDVGRLWACMEPISSLLAHARTDLPRLVAEVRRLREAVQRVRFETDWCPLCDEHHSEPTPECP